MKTTLCPLITLLFALPAMAVEGETAAQQAAEIYAQSGFTGGVVVHVGCGDGKLTAALGARDHCLVQGLASNAARVAEARETVRSSGQYGRTTILPMTGKRLPYVDNLVNLLVVEQPGAVGRAEMLRVLCPGGVMCVREADRWTTTTKPRPDDIDQWTHYLHDASNNAVAHDQVVGPPRRLQWTDGPRYARHHDRMSSVSAVVSAGGRVFSIEDEQSAISILLPSQWVLTARDAFNGTTLWKRPIEKWFTQFWPLKSGPAQLPRRLIASDDCVFVTLGFDAPFVALDAATGELVQTFAGTDAAEEAILSHGVLFVLVNPELDIEQYNDPKESQKLRQHFWNGRPRQLKAFNADSGELLWSREQTVLPATLAANNARVVFHDGDSVVCLDSRSGDEIWRSAKIERTAEVQSFYLPILVLYRDAVLFSGGETAGSQTGSWYEEGKDTMTALDLNDGRVLWTAYHPPSGYRSPEDLLIIDDLVWTGETTSGRAIGHFTGRDYRTGEIVSQFDPDVSTYWFHHRCYRGKATDNYLLMARSGTEFIDFREQHWDINHWVRGACLYGVMPANGLLYAPRHPCACYLEAKMFGFNALAPAASETQNRSPVSDADRLFRGPAYAEVLNAGQEVAADDWPTYRHDAGRSGRATTSLSAKLRAGWTTSLGGKLTSPVVAGGTLYVASVDDHLVHALDATDGQQIWQFQAGGRVDSPPTVYRGHVYFGSADGNVYCLQAETGAVAWRFLAAPTTEQLVSYSQLESVWPVHGSVLIQDNMLYFVSGRSMFVDGGLTLWRLEPTTGQVLSKTTLDSVTTDGKTIQDYVSWLNMPTALPDILSSNGKHIYMRSQPFRLDGTRLPLEAMPRKEDADQGAPDPYQIPEHAHIFSPTGFLDDTWWHRTYWLYGSTFISGWQGYYLSGKVAPAGRLLVADDDAIYGFGRKPQYFRWTTPIEHQLFRAAADLKATYSPPRRGPKETRISVPKSQSLNPTNRPLTVSAWVKPQKLTGVILAHGGNSAGYSLYLDSGKPTFAVRASGALALVQAKPVSVGSWVHLAGVLSEAKELEIFVNGVSAGKARADSLIPGNPAEGMEIGADEGSSVGEYVDRCAFNGLIDEIQVFHCPLGAREVQQLMAVEKGLPTRSGKLVLAYSFDDATATDLSSNGNTGKVEGAELVAGHTKMAYQFLGSGLRVAGHKVDYHWTEDLPLFARAMLLSDGTLFVAGPPDLVDEVTSFRQIADAQIQARLSEQVAALQGSNGALLWAVSKNDGTRLAEYPLDSPPVFDGMAAAQGRLYLVTLDGSVVCLQ